MEPLIVPYGVTQIIFLDENADVPRTAGPFGKRSFQNRSPDQKSCQATRSITVDAWEQQVNCKKRI